MPFSFLVLEVSSDTLAASCNLLGARSIETDFSEFREEIEFPNHFLPAGLRDKEKNELSRGEAVNLERHIVLVRTKLEAALGTIFDRLTLPYPKGDGAIEYIQFLKFMDERAREIDPAKVAMPKASVSAIAD